MNIDTTFLLRLSLSRFSLFLMKNLCISKRFSEWKSIFSGNFPVLGYFELELLVYWHVFLNWKSEKWFQKIWIVSDVEMYQMIITIYWRYMNVVIYFIKIEFFCMLSSLIIVSSENFMRLKSFFRAKVVFSSDDFSIWDDELRISFCLYIFYLLKVKDLGKH